LAGLPSCTWPPPSTWCRRSSTPWPE
jgi:hypothetical protein